MLVKSLKNKKLLYDTFFYGAVECGRRGYTWIMIETCINACYELRVLASKFGWPELTQFDAMDAHDAAYNGACTEDTLPLAFTDVWPNLPSYIKQSYNLLQFAGITTT
jgi:hypothetical protein